MRLVAAVLACSLPLSAAAQEYSEAITAALDTHILPGMARLAETSASLADTAEANCAAGDTALETAYHDAFDAWMHVSHLRFGPAENESRAFALAFWPDSRGSTPRTLAQLIGDEDPIVESVERYADVSIAGRGFYALEFLLFDEDISTRGSDAYRCALVQVMTQDMAATTAAIRNDWQDSHAALMRETGGNTLYQSDAEAMRALFGALTTGLEFAEDVRLGRPLGTFERPRPNRAEAWRSGRSLRNVTLSLDGLVELATALTISDAELTDRVDRAFAEVQEAVTRVDDPIFASVVDVQGRIHAEVLQQRIGDLRDVLLNEMGPSLGIAPGFNSLDGD